VTQPRDLADDLEAISRDLPQETSGFAELRRLMGLLPTPLGPLIPGSTAQLLGDPAEMMGGGSLQSPVSDVLSGDNPGTQNAADQSLNSQALVDAYANAQTGPKGFAGAFTAYALRGVYNGDFNLGDATVRLAKTEQAAGAGVQNYLASIQSPQLPYWVVGDATCIVHRVTDAAASGGMALEFLPEGAAAAGVMGRIYQDIPVIPGKARAAYINWRYTAPGVADGFNQWVFFSYRDADHQLIGGRFSQGLVFGPVATSAAYVQFLVRPVFNPPANAVYMRIEFQIDSITAGSSIQVSDFLVLSANSISPVRTVFVAGGTWVPSPGLQYFEVEAIGGGSQGAGAAATVAGQGSAGTGGGGGGYAKKLILASAITGNGTIVVGAGGSAGGAGANGQAGGLSSFAATGIATVQGNGGGASNIMAATPGSGVQALSGAGGTASGGDINIQGEDGSFSGIATGVPIRPGDGGSSVLGTGGLGAPANGVGAVGRGLGGGGGGSTTQAAAGPARAGGAGAAGAVIVTEYYGP
jgi:hypothetical protein